MWNYLISPETAEIWRYHTFRGYLSHVSRFDPLISLETPEYTRYHTFTANQRHI
jgi:hypothetical protein